MIAIPGSRGWIAGILAAALALAGIAPLSAAARPSPPVAAQSPSGDLDGILRENAVFFNILLSFSYTAAISDPYWGLRASDININLITREVRDPQGHQLIRVRVAGTVRKNNNVELNILNPDGEIVGRGFFGYDSGQIVYFDRNDRPIILGRMYWDGSYVLNDLRLPSGEQELASGFVDSCYGCESLGYAWYDGSNAQVGGGQISAYVEYDSDGGVSDIDVHWSFLRGQIVDNVPATGEAAYRFAGEATGAINSALFDLERTAESFFVNPRSLVPAPPGRALLPRFTNDTGVAVTNTSGRPIDVTYVARHYDGSLVTGDGIENPTTYAFAAGQQLAAYPAELFRGFNSRDLRPILAADSVGWLEIYSNDGELQAMFLDSGREGSGFDGNIGVGSGGSPIVFPDLRLDDGERTEISLLNLAYDDIIVRLELLDAAGNVLREEPEYFVAGYGMRSFTIGSGSDFLRAEHPGLAASLRVSCNNNNSLKSSSCADLVGHAINTDSVGSFASTYAVTRESAGPVLLGAQVTTGRQGAGIWETRVRVTKFDGTWAPVYLDLYANDGSLLATLSKALTPGGRIEFLLDGSTFPWGDRFFSGYVRVRSDSDAIAGDVSLHWADGNESQFSSYPLSGSLYDALQFNQVAEGEAGNLDYWTGIGLLNDMNRPVEVIVQIFRPDGSQDRSAVVKLNPFQKYAALLREVVQDPAYNRIGGYIRLTSTDPVSAIVFYGDSPGSFLAAIPGIPR